MKYIDGLGHELFELDINKQSSFVEMSGSETVFNYQNIILRPSKKAWIKPLRVKI